MESKTKKENHSLMRNKGLHRSRQTAFLLKAFIGCDRPTLSPNAEFINSTKPGFLSLISLKCWIISQISTCVLKLQGIIAVLVILSKLDHRLSNDQWLDTGNYDNSRRRNWLPIDGSGDSLQSQGKSFVTTKQVFWTESYQHFLVLILFFFNFYYWLKLIIILFQLFNIVNQIFIAYTPLNVIRGLPWQYHG